MHRPSRKGTPLIDPPLNRVPVANISYRHSNQAPAPLPVPLAVLSSLTEALCGSVPRRNATRRDISIHPAYRRGGVLTMGRATSRIVSTFFLVRRAKFLFSDQGETACRDFPHWPARRCAHLD